MGWFLQTMTGVCPWDYGDRMFSVKGFIRLDYAPLWAGLGCVLEEVSVFLAEKEVKGLGFAVHDEMVYNLVNCILKKNERVLAFCLGIGETIWIN